MTDTPRPHVCRIARRGVVLALMDAGLPNSDAITALDSFLARLAALDHDQLAATFGTDGMRVAAILKDQLAPRRGVRASA